MIMVMMLMTLVAMIIVVCVVMMIAKVVSIASHDDPRRPRPGLSVEIGSQRPRDFQEPLGDDQPRIGRAADAVGP